MYRLKGIARSKVTSRKSLSKVEEAEAYFLKAIEIAQAAGKIARAAGTMSLARLWQQQAKHQPNMLSEIYGWFTEAFDTEDL